MITKYITKYSSNCEVCMYYECMHADQVGQYFNLRLNCEL